MGVSVTSHRDDVKMKFCASILVYFTKKKDFFSESPFKKWDLTWFFVS